MREALFRHSVNVRGPGSLSGLRLSLHYCVLNSAAATMTMTAQGQRDQGTREGPYAPPSYAGDLDDERGA